MKTCAVCFDTTDSKLKNGEDVVCLRCHVDLNNKSDNPRIAAYLLRKPDLTHPADLSPVEIDSKLAAFVVATIRGKWHTMESLFKLWDTANPDSLPMPAFNRMFYRLAGVKPHRPRVGEKQTKSIFLPVR